MTAVVSLRTINMRDKGFCISYSPQDGALLSSIEKLGIIEPIVLLQSSPFCVICGFKRLQAAVKLGFKEVPARVMQPTPHDALLMAIHSNIGRGFNMVEKAQALSKMVEMGFQRDEVYETMALFSLSPHEKILANLLSIASAEEPLKRFIVEQALSMKTTEYMLWFDAQEKKRIVHALAPMHLTESYVREILELLHLMKIKKGKSVAGALKGATDAPDLRAKLKRKVRPMLTSLENRLEKIRKAAALPPGIDIRVDPFFEKEYIDIVARTKSEQETKEIIAKLDEVLKKGHIRSVLELTKGRVR